MYYNKRTAGITYFILISFSFLFCRSLYAANGKMNNNPDSIYYNTYLKLRGMNTQTVSSSATSDTVKAEKCSFSLVASLYTHYHELNSGLQKLVSELFVRPDLEKSIVSPSGKFRIHYNSTGTDAPAYNPNLTVDENVHQVALAFDSASSYENDYLGYLFPPGDHGLGGDDLYDVYIVGLNNTTKDYGVTSPDDETFNNPTSFIEIDNSFPSSVYSTTGLNGMRVTAAHEFHHSIQVGSYGGWPVDNEGFFYEMTSTSMEEFVYNTINDYYFYLYKYFNSPSKSFPQYEGYELCIWNIYLVKKYGFAGQMMIKRQWEYKLNNYPVLSAINQSLTDNAVSLKQALNEFGVWTYYTGERKNKYDTNNNYFDEGANYPMLSLYPDDYTSAGKRVDFLIKPFSNTFKLFMNRPLMDTIAILTTNSDFSKATANPYEDINAQVVLSGNSSDGIKLSDNYYWNVNSSDDVYTIGAAILNNIPQMINEIKEENAYPVPFSYRNNSIISVPVFYNDTENAELKIFSVSMNLVFSGNEKIEKGFGGLVVHWNGMDSKDRKLPTGVYIYVTSSDDKIKTGKLVIKNE